MKRINEKNFKIVRDKIFHNGSTFAKEAEKLGVSIDFLIAEMNRRYDGGVKNKQFKSLIVTSRKNEAHTCKVIPVTTVLTAMPMPDVQDTVPIEKQETEPEKLKKLKAEETELKESIRQEEEAKKAAEKELHELNVTINYTKKKIVEMLQGLNSSQERVKVTSEKIEKIRIKKASLEKELAEKHKEIDLFNENYAFLVAPFNIIGAPEGVRLVSATPIEGVETEIVTPEEDYYPQDKLELVMMFETRSEYFQAKAYVALVTKFLLEEMDFTLVVTDVRIKKMLHLSGVYKYPELFGK